MLSRPVATSLLAVALVFAVAGARPVHAGEPAAEQESDAGGSEDGAETPMDVLSGKLVVSKGDDGQLLAAVQVGKDRHLLEGVDGESVKKLARKYVTVRGRWAKAAGKDGPPAFAPEKEAQPVEQDGTGVAGTVGGDKGAPQLTRADGTTIDVPRSAASKLKAFDGKHVRVEGYVEQGTGGVTVAQVTDVRRELLPGEREPSSENDVLAGAWTGKLVAEKVPAGAPNTKPGDALALAFATKGDAEKGTGKAIGRLFDTYDVVGYRVSKFKTKDRSAKVDVQYSFGSGDYSITLRGAFSPDWKTFEGEWSSGFLGSGTFRLAFEALPPVR